jgi:hypothetical protein
MTTIAVENPSQTGTRDDAQLHASFARQPILDRDGMLCGYEIKVRAPEWQGNRIKRPAFQALEPDSVHRIRP